MSICCSVRLCLARSRACIDYVITHELTHLIHPHHGRAFYDLLEALMPDWRSRKQRLERILS
jgi:predicted metal-dependent hydrolase